MINIDTLPYSWVCVTLEEVAIINPPKPTLEDDEEVTFLPMSLVEEESGKYYLTDTRKYGEVKKGYTGFTDGDVIFAKITPCMENGKVALLGKLTNSVGFGSTEFHVVRPSIAIDGKFLFHFLVRRTFRGVAQRNMTGSAGQLRVPKGFLAEAEIPIPPLPEQRAIVAKIEQLFSELDNGIANLTTALEQLKVYRQAVLKKAFDGELTRAWRAKQKDLLTAEGLLEQIRVERKKVSNGLASITNQDLNDFSPLPEKWFYGNLELLAEAIDPQPSHRTPPKVEGGIPYIGTADIDKVTGKIDLNSARKVSQSVLTEHRNRYKLLPGDFVIGKIGTIGKPFFIPTNVELTLSANVVLVQCNRNIAVPEYLFYLSKSPLIEKQFEKGAKATTQAAFGIKKVRTLIIPICSIIEQHQIVQEIESRLSVCDKVEETIKDSLNKAEALRQSILKKAFEGKLLTKQELEACRQQPDWEPAEKLLERIKKEGGKAARTSKKVQTVEVL